MKFRLKPKNGDKENRMQGIREGMYHDQDLQFNGVKLVNGVILEHNPTEYLSLVDSLIYCSSPVCSAQNTY
jgi:hypothetical protein